MNPISLKKKKPTHKCLEMYVHTTQKKKKRLDKSTYWGIFWVYAYPPKLFFI